MSETIVQVINELTALMVERDALRARVVELESKKFDNRPKLGKKEVENIKELRRIGYTIEDIAAVYDVNKSTISRTLRGVYH